MLNRIWGLPSILLIFTAFLWGGNAVVGKVLADVMGPVTISFFRILISVLIIIPFAYSVMKEELPKALRNIVYLIVLSLTGVVGYNLLVYWSLNYTTAVHVTLINSSSPIFITVLSFFIIKEDVSKKIIISIFLSMLGVLIVMTQGNIMDIFLFQYNKGDVIMVAAVMCWALYSVLLKIVISKMSSLSIFGYTLLLATPLVLAGSLIEMMFIPINHFNGLDLLSILYLGIFPSVFAFLMWNRAISLVGPSTASVFINLTPVFGGVLAYLFLHEQLTVNHLLGGFLVFFATLLASSKKYATTENELERVSG